MAIRFGWTRPQTAPEPSDDERVEEVSSAPAELDAGSSPEEPGPAGTARGVMPTENPDQTVGDPNPGGPNQQARSARPRLPRSTNP